MASKPLTVITDRTPEKWERFLLDAIQHTQAATKEGCNGPLGMYYSALYEDGRVLSGYEHLDPTELALVAGSAIMDAVDLYIEQNFADYYARMMAGELNTDEEDTQDE